MPLNIIKNVVLTKIKRPKCFSARHIINSTSTRLSLRTSLRSTQIFLADSAGGVQHCDNSCPSLKDPHVTKQDVHFTLLRLRQLQAQQNKAWHDKELSMSSDTELLQSQILHHVKSAWKRTVGCDWANVSFNRDHGETMKLEVEHSSGTFGVPYR